MFMYYYRYIQTSLLVQRSEFVLVEEAVLDLGATKPDSRS